jgi:ring-1,2-phenylacetyl-CoA epoxidase subunit PaaC
MAGEETTIGSEAVKNLTLGLCESKLILSRVMVSWMIRGPSLEADNAIAALAQEELGHAQVLTGIYERNFTSKKEESTERVNLKSPLTHPAVRPFERPRQSWPEVVALLCLWDTALTTVIDGLSSSSFVPLRHVASKMCQEEGNHWIFARAAAADLLARGPHVATSFREACKRLLPEVDRWFNDIADIDRLRRDGVIADAVPLASFASKVGPILEDLKLSWPSRGAAAAE